MSASIRPDGDLLVVVVLRRGLNLMDPRLHLAPAACGAVCAVCSGTLSFDSNTARHPSESCGVFCRRHAVMRSASGIWSQQSRQTSGVQAICCSRVPRFSCADAAP